MNIFSRIRSTLAALLEKKSGIAPADWLRAADIEADGGAQLLSPYAQSAWVYIAVSVLAETVAQVPFRIARIPNSALRTTKSVFQRILGENLVETGPVIELFENPHPMMDRALFWETVMTWRALRGEFFILPLDAQDQPVDLAAAPDKSHRSYRSYSSPIHRMITLSPDQFWHIVSGYELQGWRYTGSPLMSPLVSQVLLPGEVIHSRAPNPYQFWRGLSPLSVALLPAMSDYAAAQFMKGLMINNADSGLIVTSKEQLSAEQQLAVTAKLEERKRKAGTADRPLFLFGGITIQKPPVSSADLQFLENRKLNRQEIGAIFKVPESLMGFSDTKHSIGGASSIEQERMAFIENTIAAHCRRLEAAVQPIVKSFGPDLIGYFDLDCLPLLQQARRDRLEAASKAFAMGVPFNEINSVYDLGFRSLPWGDTGHLPAKLQEAGRLSAENDSSEVEQEEADDQNPFEQLARLLARQRQSDHEPLPTPVQSTIVGNRPSATPSPGGEGRGEGEPSVPQGDQVGRRSTASVTRSEEVGRGGTRPYHQDGESVRSLTGRLQKFFFEQRSRVLARLSSATAHDFLNSLYVSIEDDALLENRLKLPLLASMEAGAAQAWNDSGSNTVPSPALAIEELWQQFRTRLLDVNSHTLYQVREAALDGTRWEEANVWLVCRIKAIFREAHDIRAVEIARNLLSRTWEQGAQAMLRKLQDANPKGD